MVTLVQFLSGVVIKGQTVGLVNSTVMDCWQIVATCRTIPGPLFPGDATAYLDSDGNWGGYMVCRDFLSRESALGFALLHADKDDTPTPYDEIDQEEVD